MRLIDADGLKEQVVFIHKAVNTRDRNPNYDTGFHSATSQIMGLIEYMPTVERPRGEWINHLDLTEDYYGESKQCSLCGYKDYNTRRFSWHKFCPNCGADMRGE